MNNVVSLSGASVESPRRDEFLKTVAQAFDRYVADCGCEPEAIVFTLSGITQQSQIGWDVRGASEAGVSSILALAAAHAMSEAQQSRQGL